MRSEFLSKFLRLALPYWRSEDKWKAYGLLVAIVGMNLGMVYIQVLVNVWIREFYDILQSLDKAKFLTEILRFCFLAGAYIAQAVYMLYLSQMLQIRWRKWLTGQYLQNWLSNQAYYRISFAESKTDNPDQRISEDINSFIELTINLGTSLLNSVATLVSFLAILWQLSGILDIPVTKDWMLHVPGYMVWAALIYSVLGTWLTMWIGNPLILLNFNQQRFEADFRFSMVRIRENSESIALYRGEKQEGGHLEGRFNILMDNFWKIMRRQKRLSWLTNGYSQAAVIFPVLMAAPRFFSGQMHLGGLMQTVSAFAAVQGALSYLVSSYTTIAKWHAVIDRLVGFSHAMDRLESSELPRCARRAANGGSIKTDSLSIFLPDGKLLIDELRVNIEPASHLIITGPSGCGKSTLVRTLAGIWPFCKGEISWPDSSSVMFLPQRPYLPLGTLRDVLSYPNPNGFHTEELEQAMHLCGLDYLIEDMDKNGDWSHALSMGEQQRLAFARVMLTEPDFIFLDEATASLDENAEANLYALLRSRLPHAAVTSVGHRSTLLAWHSNRLSFNGDGTWVQSVVPVSGNETHKGA